MTAGSGGQVSGGFGATDAGGTGGSGAGGNDTGGSGGDPDAGGSGGSGAGGNDTGGNGGDSDAGGSGGLTAGSGGEALGGFGGTDAGAGVGGTAGDGSVEPPSAFSIVVDYRFDTADAFGDPDRRNVMAYAASVWQEYIGSEFEDIPAGTAVRTRHPERPDEEGMVYELEYDIDDLVIVVGFADTGGHLATTSFSFTYQVADEALLERLYERHFGPVFQPWIAETTFDLTTSWFVDPTPETSDDIPADGTDLLSTAIHEMGHALGFSVSDAFQALVSEGTFIGPKAMEVYGGPVPLAPDLLHFEEGMLFQGEEPLMTPQAITGVRKRVTALDLAALEDIGYEIHWSALD